MVVAAAKESITTMLTSMVIEGIPDMVAGTVSKICYFNVMEVVREHPLSRGVIRGACTWFIGTQPSRAWIISMLNVNEVF
eukprot:1140835-Pelagomonas_calceolata.AAC.2